MYFGRVPEMHWDVGTGPNRVTPGPNIQTLFQSSGADWSNQIDLISSRTLTKIKDVNYLLFLRRWNHQEPQYEYLHFEIHKNYLVNWGLSSPIRNNISSKYCLVISKKSNIILTSLGKIRSPNMRNIWNQLSVSQYVSNI